MLHPRFRNLWDTSHQTEYIQDFTEKTEAENQVDLKEYWKIRDLTSTSFLRYNPAILEPHSILKFKSIDKPKSLLFTFESSVLSSKESLIHSESVTELWNEYSDSYHNSAKILVESDSVLLAKYPSTNSYSLKSLHSFDEFKSMQGLIDFEGVDKILNPEDWQWLIETEFRGERSD
ncbi:MAG: hypothetical protein WDZ94_04545 [Patescibacteria group bacterium]